jgi:peroxiredoxin
MFQLLTFVAAVTTSIIWVRDLPLPDCQGNPVHVDGDKNLFVVCFLGTECPLAQLYAKRLGDLSRQFEDQGVRFVGVVANPQDSAADVKAYWSKHEFPFPVVHDPQQQWMRALGADRTPQVFVIGEQQQVLYRGRIDDQYQPGVSRAEPTQHDLRDALEAVLQRQPVPRPVTTAVGCLITPLDRIGKTPLPDEAGVPTFHRDIVPILNRHCVECHRDGEIGPFALQDYDEVVGWGEMIMEVVDQQRMPPWGADPNVGEFVGAREMPTEAIETLRRWVAGGMPEGDPADQPAEPQFVSGWQLPRQPDQVLEMRSRPFVVPAEGIIEYQYFVVDPGFQQDRWVRAAEVVPGNRSVVHHAIVFVRPPDGRRMAGIGWLGAYVPGQRLPEYPSDLARLVPAGSKLVFQMHYTPNGQVAEDITRVGLVFADESEVKHELITTMAINQDFDIPPQAPNYEVRSRVQWLPDSGRLLGLAPHMHLRGKSFRVIAEVDGRERSLLHVPRYDFNWQHVYQFARPLDLERLKNIRCVATFDNSDANPFNPDPDQTVFWGDQTSEEMSVAFLDVSRPRSASRIPVASEEEIQSRRETRRAKRQAAREFIDRFDRDGDGNVASSEVPVAFRRFAFRDYDRNRDGFLSEGEVIRFADNDR